MENPKRWWQYVVLSRHGADPNSPCNGAKSTVYYFRCFGTGKISYQCCSTTARIPTHLAKGETCPLQEAGGTRWVHRPNRATCLQQVNSYHFQLLSGTLAIKSHEKRPSPAPSDVKTHKINTINRKTHTHSTLQSAKRRTPEPYKASSISSYPPKPKKPNRSKPNSYTSFSLP